MLSLSLLCFPSSSLISILVMQKTMKRLSSDILFLFLDSPYRPHLLHSHGKAHSEATRAQILPRPKLQDLLLLSPTCALQKPTPYSESHLWSSISE